MKSFLQKMSETSLILRIVIGLVIGAVLGIAAPNATGFAILGNIFVGALKGIAPILVFVLVISAIANASGNIGSRFKTVIFVYMLSTFLAAVIAVVGSFLFPVTMVLTTGDISNVPPGGIGEVLSNLLVKMVSNPVVALAEANYISVLFWSILFGLALKTFAKPETLNVMSDFADMASSAVRAIIQFAPFGILGLVYDTVSNNGLSIFADYGKLLLLLLGCMFSVALIVDPLIAFLLLRRNPFPLVFTCLRESGVTAFFTRSSAANIPVNMNLCDRLGLDRDFYSVSIPLGSTINMDGAAITITVMTLAVAHTLGLQVDFLSALVLSLLATISACGASGVAGGSLLLIPMACSLFGISNDIAMQAVAVGFIISVIQDSVETALNSSGDAMFTATAEFYDMMKRGEKIEFFESGLRPEKKR